jgi:hypothetical protein
MQDIIDRARIAETLAPRMREKAEALDELIRSIEEAKQYPEDDPRYDDRDSKATAISEYLTWSKSSEPGGAREGLPVVPGPAEISFDPNLCDISEDDRKAIRTYSACDGIADAALAHEAHHTSVCLALGKAAYIDRGAPETAREEVEAYGVERELLRAALAQVLARDAGLAYHYRTKDGIQELEAVTTGPGGASSTGEGAASVQYPAGIHFWSTLAVGSCTFAMDSRGLGDLRLTIVDWQGVAVVRNDDLAGTVKLTCPDSSFEYATTAPAGQGDGLLLLPLVDGATAADETENEAWTVELHCPAR